jgi:hypothetical protein
MKISAIGIYSLVNYKRIKSGKKSTLGLFSHDPLKNFEEKILPFILKDIQLYENEGYQRDGEHFYVKQDHNQEFLYVIVSDRDLKLDRKSYYYLFNNIQHIHIRENIVKATLNDVVDTPINYIAKDIHIQRASENVNELLTTQVRPLIDKMVERGEKLKILEEKTPGLVLASAQFQDQSEKLNKCWCSR